MRSVPLRHPSRYAIAYVTIKGRMSSTTLLRRNMSCGCISIQAHTEKQKLDLLLHLRFAVIIRICKIQISPPASERKDLTQCHCSGSSQPLSHQSRDLNLFKGLRAILLMWPKSLKRKPSLQTKSRYWPVARNLFPLDSCLSLQAQLL